MSGTKTCISSGQRPHSYPSGVRSSDGSAARYRRKTGSSPIIQSTSEPSVTHDRARFWRWRGAFLLRPADIKNIDSNNLLIALILFRAQVSLQFPALRKHPAGERGRHALTSLMLGIFGSSAAGPPKRSITCAVPIILAQTLRVT